MVTLFEKKYEPCIYLDNNTVHNEVSVETNNRFKVPEQNSF